MRPGLLLSLLLAVAPAGAQVPQPRRAPPTDGASAGLSLTAFSARQGRRLLARDTDGDGKVSKAEFFAGGERGGKRAGVDPAGRFAALDRNGDGAVDRSEMDGVAARRFARLDTDRNGVLTAAERTARRRNAGDPSD